MDITKKIHKHQKAIKNKSIQTLVFLIAACMIIYARNPLLFAYPRVYAEEPGAYLLNALSRPLPVSLGFTTAGYFSLTPNLAAEIAGKIFPLEYAGHVFTFTGLIIQLLTVTTIFRSAGMLLPYKWLSALSALALLVISKPETWMNSVYSMYWLATGMFYILNAERIQKAHIAYSTIAFLSGATSLIWLPIFGIRWLYGYEFNKRTRRDFRILIIVGIGALSLVINAFLTFFATKEVSIGSRLRPEMLINLPRGFGSMFLHLFVGGGYPLSLSAMVVAAFCFMIAALLTVSSWPFRVYSCGSLVYYALIVATLSFNMNGGNRYALPITAGIFSLAVLGIINFIDRIAAWKSLYKAFGCTVLIILFLGNKLIEYRDFSGIYAASNYVYDIRWERWKDQIMAVDRAKGGYIKTFPQWEGTGLEGGNWGFQLPPNVGR